MSLKKYRIGRRADRPGAKLNRMSMAHDPKSKQDISGGVNDEKQMAAHTNTSGTTKLAFTCTRKRYI